MQTEAHIISKTAVHPSGFRWLYLTKLTYLDKKGRTRLWEVCERTKPSGSTSEADSVFLCALIKYRRSRRPDEVLVVKQFRPPMGADTIEFVAGLIDSGESAMDTARRELAEEVGYLEGVTVMDVTAPVVLDPGLSTSKSRMVVLEIDGDLPANQSITSNQEEGEDIETIRIPAKDLIPRLKKLETQGCVVDQAVWSYAYGLVQGSQETTSQPRDLDMDRPRDYDTGYIAGVATTSCVVAIITLFLLLTKRN